MNTFSCRFECTEDYTRFVIAANACGILVLTIELESFQSEKGGPKGPDVFVEFACEADLVPLRKIMQTIPDLHVGIQTLRQVPMKDNSMERDFSL